MKRIITAIIDTMFNILPEFIDKYYPKGNKNRNQAIIAISNFLLWIKEQ